MVKAMIQLDTNKFGKGYFLIDTGSSANQLFASMKPYIPQKFLVPEEKEVVKTLGKEQKLSIYNMNFVIGDVLFEEKFNLADKFDISNEIPGYYLIGILGTQFLMRHHLVLDYAKQSLYLSERKKRPEVSECNYLFDMRYGLSNWGIPVMGICKDEDHCITMVADSGCNISSITAKAVDSLQFNQSETKGYIQSRGFDWKIKKQPIKELQFALISLSDEAPGMKIVPKTQTFSMWPNIENLMEKKEVVPVCGLLGNDFLLKEKIILDYGCYYMYSLKES